MRLWYTCLILLVLSNSVGLGLIYWRLDHLAQRFPFALLESSVKTQSEIATKLNNLQSLFAAIVPASSPSPVLGMADLLPDKPGNPAPSSNTFISVNKDAPEAVPVYKEQADFSVVLGQLVPDYKYPYYTKTADWYLVSLASGKTGWVKASLVREEVP